MPDSPTATADQHVFLIGRPPIGELLTFIRSVVVDGQSADQGAIVAEWRVAHDHVRVLERDEAGCADHPTIEPLPASLRAHADVVAATPMFRKAFQYLPSRFAVVDLDQLVVYQKHINLAFAAKVQERLGRSPSELEVMGACIPIDLEQQSPPTRVMQVAANAYNFVSPSTDLRFLEALLLTPEQLQGIALPGPAVAALALVVGYGSNHVNLIEAEGRLILNNGSHRAYALREMGIRRMPCVIQTASRRDELELANDEVQRHPDRYLAVPRPPMLKDYFDPKLRMVVPVARTARMLKLSFGIDKSELP
jgi:hypothetical protein